jgi:hypothetical protein
MVLRHLDLLTQMEYKGRTLITKDITKDKPRAQGEKGILTVEYQHYDERGDDIAHPNSMSCLNAPVHFHRSNGPYNLLKHQKRDFCLIRSLMKNGKFEGIKVSDADIDTGDIILFSRRCMSMSPFGALICGAGEERSVNKNICALLDMVCSLVYVT